MSLFFTLSTIAEVLVGGFIIWGLFNEGKIADFEQNLFNRIKARFSKPQASVVRVKAQRSRHCA